jgi:hypothetical protein
LTLVVRGLMKDRVLFVTTYRGDQWRGVTLVPRGMVPEVHRGEVARVVSWSGRFDSTVAYATGKRVGRKSRPLKRRPFAVPETA